MKNCLNCKFNYFKDISYNEWDFPEYICICELDNHYIGYPDDAEIGGCNEWRKQDEE